MAHFTKRKRADGSTAYRSDILIIRKGAIIHQESRTFDRMALAKAWGAKRKAEIQEQDVFGIQKSVLIKTFNGHFVVAGNFKLVDMWQGTIIGSVADTKGIEKVDLHKIGFNPDELTAFTIGNGKKEVTIFVDPQCNYCHDLIGQLESLGKEYQFKLVLIPVFGKESAEITKKLICNKDKSQSLKALIDKDYSKLPPLPQSVPGAQDAQGNQIETCNIQALQKAVVATKLLDIEGVPYIFLPSKNAHRGGAILEKDLEDEINGR